jgi:hypothetical protein
MLKLVFPILSNILYIVLCACFLQIPVLCIGSDRAWIDGTCSLIDRANHTIPVIDDSSMLAPAKQSPQIGDQKRFYAVDFSRSGRAYFTNATCRAVGEFCYIFVENSQWEKNVTNTGVAKLRRAFDESTPANASKGIYKLETENLGLPPDEIDLDPKIYILILDIPDTQENGNFVAGYFEPINQERGVVRDPKTGMQFQSNEVEMIYIDSNPLKVEDVIAREILAHEFQHLIHWRYDPDEDIWINEGCSEYSSLFLCGYQSGRISEHVKAYEKEPQTSLVFWGNGMGSLANYGASYLWMMYLHEHYGGISTISSIITEPAHGINGINTVLISRGYSQRFNDVFSDWKVANYLDNDTYESGKYGYSNLDLVPIYSYKDDAFPITNRSHFIQSWSANYIEFTGGNGASNLNIDLSVKQSYDFDVRVISIKNEKPIAVESMPIESGKGQISISSFGYNADKVVLIPNWIPKTNADIGETVSYTYSANLGDKIGLKVKLLPNAINSRYVDLIARISENTVSDIPRISLTRLGKTIVNNQRMTPISNIKKDVVYVYQIYFPIGWNGDEIKWQISYLGRSLISGDLGGVSIQSPQLKK